MAAGHCVILRMFVRATASPAALSWFQVSGQQKCSKKVVVVFGATGAQGGSVVNALKGDEQFVVKAATRNPDSDKAKRLAVQGIEVIKADFDDKASLTQALQSAYGVFLNTNYWEVHDEAKEIQQGKNAIDAAKECGVQHLVFSGLRSTKPSTGKVAKHFETKAVISEYLAKQGIPFTEIRCACYFENLLTFFRPRKIKDNEYAVAIPMGDKPLDTICISEVGECVHQIFLRPTEFVGQAFGLSSHSATVEQYADILTKVFGDKKFVDVKLTVEQCAQLGYPGAEDMAIMFEFYQKGNCGYDVELTRRLHPAIPDFEQWATCNRNLLVD